MSPMLYQAYQNTMDFTSPLRSGASTAKAYLKMLTENVSDKVFGRLSAALEMISRTTLTYARPDYDIQPVLVGNRECPVTEEVPFKTPFGSLLMDPSAFSLIFGTTNSETPLMPVGAPSIRASTRCTMFSVRSCSPPEMKILVPVIL